MSTPLNAGETGLSGGNIASADSNASLKRSIGCAWAAPPFESSRAATIDLKNSNCISTGANRELRHQTAMSKYGKSEG